MEPTSPDLLKKWATNAGAKQIITPFVACGPLRNFIDAAVPILAKQGITLCEWQRDWDLAIWPHATAGFFKVKKNIPGILTNFGMI